MRLCSRINLNYSENKSLDEVIRSGLSYLKTKGFDAADFTMSLIEPLGDGWMECIEKAVSETEKLGIRFEISHLPFNVKTATDPSVLPKFERDVFNAIDASKMLGVDFAVIHPNTITVPLETFDRKKSYDSVMNHLSPFVEYGDKVGVKIAVENMRVVHNSYPTHRYCQDPDELCEIADALGASVCWDFGHANLGGLCQSEALRYLGNRVKVLHVNDNTRADDDHLPPFIGNIDWKDAMKGLSEIGFTGLFNYEIETKRIPKELRDPFADYLVEAAREIISYRER